MVTPAALVEHIAAHIACIACIVLQRQWLDWFHRAWRARTMSMKVGAGHPHRCERAGVGALPDYE